MTDDVSSENVEAAGADADEAEPGSEISELSQFLMTANKIAAHLESLHAFEDAEVSTQDWLLLRNLAEDGSSLSKASRRIGAGRKAFKDRVKELGRAGLIKIEENEGSKGTQLSLTTAGKVVLDRLDAGLGASLSGAEAISVKQISSARRAATRMAKKLLPKKEPQTAAA